MSADRIFISHASRDAALVQALVRALEDLGIGCWISGRDVPPGANYQAAIVGAITGARALVLLLTEFANASDEVKKELSLASALGIAVYPVRIGEVQPNAALRYELATRQWIEGDDTPATATRLAAAIRGTTPAPSADEPAAILALPDKPSIAVLPFANISGDAEQEYFADGMTEEVITALSRIRSFFVIARHTSFAYKGRSVDVAAVGRELRVRYVVEGSVRRGGNRLRITGQLIDAASGVQLWADRFDGTLDDVFALQDQVTASLISAIEPSIRAVEIGHAQRKRTDSLAAYDLVLRALPKLYAFSRDGLREGTDLLRQAIEVDPGYAMAHALAGMSLWWRTMQAWLDPSPAIAAEMHDLGRRALALGPDDPEVLAYAGFLLSCGAGDLRAGLPALQRAVDLNPSSAHTLGYLAQVHALRGDRAGAFACAERSRRLSPNGRQGLAEFAVGMASYFGGAFDDALQAADARIGRDPAFQGAWTLRAASLAQLGRLEEACEAVRQVLRLSPEMTMRHVSTYWRLGKQGFPRPEFVSSYCDGLRMAGLPDG